MRFFFNFRPDCVDAGELRVRSDPQPHTRLDMESAQTHPRVFPEHQRECAHEPPALRTRVLQTDAVDCGATDEIRQRLPTLGPEAQVAEQH